MIEQPELWIARAGDEVLLWRSAEPASQRVVRLHTSAPALLAAAADDGRKPSSLSAVWLTRDGFEQLVARAVGDPDDALGEVKDKALCAQHRLATRFALVRVGFERAPSGRPMACFSLRGAARHALKDWIVRTEEVDARRWHLGATDKAWHPRAYAVDPAVWCPWVGS